MQINSFHIAACKIQSVDQFSSKPISVNSVRKAAHIQYSWFKSQQTRLWKKPTYRRTLEQFMNMFKFLTNRSEKVIKIFRKIKSLSKCFVIIHGKLMHFFFISVTPLVKVHCRNPSTVNVTDNFTCLCEASGGNLTANVTWYKGNKKIGESGKAEQILRRINVSRDDAGIYRCEAKSHVSAINETEVELIVNCK